MKKAFFLSDTHLGASYFPDSRDRELRVVRFLDSIKDEAEEIFLLGDVLDYWYEYRYVVPRGFVRFFGKLAELADSGIRITWLIGNHDIWIFDYIPTELGIEVVDGTLVREVMGTTMLMAHGDGVWQHSKKFKLLRGLFRNKICQKLFASVHPRWTVPFANAWSANSRHYDLMKEKEDTAVPPFNPETFEGENRSTRHDINYHIYQLYRYSCHYEREHPECRYFLYGHLHRIVDLALPSGGRMIIPGDWINKFSYLEFDGKRMSLLVFNPKE